MADIARGVNCEATDEESSQRERGETEENPSYADGAERPGIRTRAWQLDFCHAQLDGRAPGNAPDTRDDETLIIVETRP
jgi:hypothetical protein